MYMLYMYKCIYIYAKLLREISSFFSFLYTYTCSNPDGNNEMKIYKGKCNYFFFCFYIIIF